MFSIEKQARDQIVAKLSQIVVPALVGVQLIEICQFLNSLPEQVVHEEAKPNE